MPTGLKTYPNLFLFAYCFFTFLKTEVRPDLSWSCSTNGGGDKYSSAETSLTLVQVVFLNSLKSFFLRLYWNKYLYSLPQNMGIPMICGVQHHIQYVMSTRIKARLIQLSIGYLLTQKLGMKISMPKRVYTAWDLDHY